MRKLKEQKIVKNEIESLSFINYIKELNKNKENKINEKIKEDITKNISSVSSENEKGISNKKNFCRKKKFRRKIIKKKNRTLKK